MTTKNRTMRDQTFQWFGYCKSLNFFSDSHSGAIAEHCAKIAHEVVNQNIFLISKKNQSLINSFSNDIQFVGVSLVLQKLWMGKGPPRTTSISYFSKVCT